MDYAPVPLTLSSFNKFLLSLVKNSVFGGQYLLNGLQQLRIDEFSTRQFCVDQQ